MKHHDLALLVAEHENVTIAEMRLFNGFLQGHRAHGDSIVRSHQVNLSGSGDLRELVNHNWYPDATSNRCRSRDALRLCSLAVPLFLLVAFFTTPARLVLQCLFF